MAPANDIEKLQARIRRLEAEVDKIFDLLEARNVEQGHINKRIALYLAEHGWGFGGDD